MKTSNKARGFSGFTLLETVVVLGLVSVLIAVMGTLFQSFMSATRSSTYKQTALQGCVDALNLVGKDLSSAVEITQPTVAAGSAVQLKRVYPFGAARFPKPLPPVAPLTWTQHPNSSVQDISYTYFPLTQELIRSVTFNSSTTSATAATGICQFQCQLFTVSGNPNAYPFAQITVTTMPHNDGIVQVTKRMVALHLPPAGMH